MHRLLVKLSLFLLTATATACAQTYIADQVTFSEPGSFTQAQLEAAVQVHKGTSLTAEQLGAAAQRLADSGYFEDVGATIEGKVDAATIKFSEKPISKSQMLHVGFQNFVWLTDEEIEAAIHNRFPLFIDYLPENSPQQAVIQDALIAALHAKSITATVAFDTYEPTLRHPVQELIFRVKDPSIRVADIKLAGVMTSFAPLVQKSVNAASRSVYIAGPADLTTADIMLAPLLDAGYADAKLTDVSVVPAAAVNGSVGVVLSARVRAGDVYRVATISYAGTPLFSAEAFHAAAELHPRDLASNAALLQTLEPIDAAYRNKGYMDVAVRSGAVSDAATHQIAYTVTVLPGEQYRVHEVTVNGLTPIAKADFDRGYLMKTGELYNPSYLAGFLKNNTALRALAGYQASWKTYADPSTHTVDVVLTFARMGGR